MHEGGGIIPSLSLHTLESFLAKQSLEKFASTLSLASTEKLHRNKKTPLMLNLIHVVTLHWHVT